MDIQDFYKLLKPIIIEYKANYVDYNLLPHDRLKFHIRIKDYNIYIVVDYIDMTSIMLIFPPKINKPITQNGDYLTTVNKLKIYLSTCKFV